MGEGQHDQPILNVLDKARENNVRLTLDKFQFKVTEASFSDLAWTPKVIKPDQNKIKAIRDMLFPKNLTELQSFMGMINYLNRLSPVIARTAERLKQLVNKEVPFV